MIEKSNAQIAREVDELLRLCPFLAMSQGFLCSVHE